jgi:hemoglobin
VQSSIKYWLKSIVNLMREAGFPSCSKQKNRLPLALLLMILLSSGASAQVSEPVAGASTTPFYNDLGGREGVHKVVVKLVTILLADARVSATFDGVDTDRLRLRFEEQFCHLSGGPCIYTGKPMQEIHQDLKITNKQFNAVIEDLQSAMDACDITSHVQNRLLARLASMQRQIVTR